MKWHWDRFLSECFGFPLLVINPPTLHTYLHLHVAVLPEELTGEDWKPPKRNVLLEIREKWIEKNFFSLQVATMTDAVIC
jgi:hypothetical protein